MRTFIITWAGQIVSTLGSGLTSFALGVWVYETTGSPALFAVSMVLYSLPNVLVSPVAGVLADRWERRLVMVLSDSGAGLSSLFVLLMLLTGELQVWHVHLAILFNSAFSAFQWPPLLGALIGPSPGRGMGLLFVTAGLLYMLVASITLWHPRIRRLEVEIPDALAGASDA